MSLSIKIIQQFPSKMRYSSYFGKLVADGLSYYGFKTELIEPDLNIDTTKLTNKDFLPHTESILYELASLYSLHKNANYQDNTIVFCLDPSFPGYATNLCTWFDNVYVYCHATSINEFDIFENKRDYKWPIEQSFLNTCNLVFVATHYHKDKLIQHGVKEEKIKVVGFPYPPILRKFKESLPPFLRKEFRILIPSRMTRQKINPKLYEIILNLEAPVEVKYFTDWDSYYMALAQSYLVVSLADEDTFGISLAEACELGTPILAPNKCAYPELYPKEFIFEDENDLVGKYSYIIKRYREMIDLAYNVKPFNENFVKDIVDNILEDLEERKIIKRGVEYVYNNFS